MTVAIRPFVPADTEPVVALWEACELTRPWNDPRIDLARAHAWLPELLLVADTELAAEPAIVGTVMAGYDGHRGWLYSLAVDPAHRGRGIARDLITRAERGLAQLGCPKINLMVRADNEAVIGFYDRLGFDRSDVTVLQRAVPQSAAPAHH